MVDLLVSVHVTIPFDPSLRGRAVQVLDVQLKIGIIGSSSPFSNTFYWRVS